jgi:hypothetical protein
MYHIYIFFSLNEFMGGGGGGICRPKESGGIVLQNTL